jgi:hypothetical protein
MSFLPKSFFWNGSRLFVSFLISGMVVGATASFFIPSNYGAMGFMALAQTLQAMNEPTKDVERLETVPVAEAYEIKTLLDVGYRKVPGPSGAYLEMVDLPRTGDTSLVLTVRGPSQAACTAELKRIESDLQIQYQAKFDAILNQRKQRVLALREEIELKQKSVDRLRAAKRSSEVGSVVAIYESSLLENHLSVLKKEEKQLSASLSPEANFTFNLRKVRFWAPETSGARLIKWALLGGILGALLYGLFTLVRGGDFLFRPRTALLQT